MQTHKSCDLSDYKLFRQNFQTFKSVGIWNFQMFEKSTIFIFNSSQLGWPSFVSPGTEINQYSVILTKKLKKFEILFQKEG